jgi:2-oxoisovalerate dehydrogenase E1 component
MFWRTGGRWEAPVIIMASCGAYRPGLGPFHAESLESVMAHIPGIDVVMPSNAGDAAGLLNAAFDSGRPTVFFYPKNCLYDRRKMTSDDVSGHLVPIGKANIVHPGKDITLVGWGNMIALCERVLREMEREGISVELIDLRSLSPWDEHTVLHSVQKTGKLLVVQEENRTCGFGGEILATVSERATGPATVRRLTRPDTYLPYHFSNQLALLPSFKSIIATIADMCGYEAIWESSEQPPNELLTINAAGLNPSDESVNILEWHIQVGSCITEGERLAEFETDKTVFEFESPVNGRIVELLASAGSTIRVGEPLMRVEPSHAKEIRSHSSDPDEGLRVTLQTQSHEAAPVSSFSQSLPSLQRGTYIAGLSAIATAKGGRLVSNQELVQRFPERTAREIFDLTGIQTRCWVDAHESALSLAISAIQSVFVKEDLTMREIDVMICSTGTPQFTTPSMACLLLSHFSHQQKQEVLIPAYDISAACSGFLYALQAAYDFLHARPKAAVLIVTAETLSQKLDRSDFSTAPLFGDAASATVVYGAEHPQAIKTKLSRPVLSAKGDKGRNLTVPAGNNGQYVSMSGQRVFVEAVRKMKFILESACREGGMKLSDLDLIVPHQANQRILEALQRRLDVTPERVYRNIRHTGNTSSSSIPLCLETLLEERTQGERIGLCAFGGGFTFGGAILEIV